MDIKTKSIVKIAVILVIAVFLAYSYGRISDCRLQSNSSQNAIKLGLDLRGGVYVLLEAKPKPGETITKEKMDGAVEVIRAE